MTPEQIAQSEHTTTIKALYDESSPTSLVNIIPLEMKPLLHMCRDKIIALHNYDSDHQIRRAYKLNDRDERLRLGFWDEYNRATSLGAKMSMSRVMDNGAMYIDTFLIHYAPYPDKMAYVFLMPDSYVDAMKFIHKRTLERYKEIAALPIFYKSANGEKKIDYKACQLILKVGAIADMRLNGAIIQRMQVDQRTLQVNTTIPTPNDLVAQIASMSIEDLEEMDRKMEVIKKSENQVKRTLSENDKYYLNVAPHHQDALLKVRDVDLGVQDKEEHELNRHVNVLGIDK